jgi:hypothetical protein
LFAHKHTDLVKLEVNNYFQGGQVLLPCRLIVLDT